MNTVEVFIIILAYTLLDLAVGIGLGIWVAAKLAERYGGATCPKCGSRSVRIRTMHTEYRLHCDLCGYEESAS